MVNKLVIFEEIGNLDAHGKIIKIIEVKSRDRIALPQEARDKLEVKEGEYVAFLEDSPGIRVVKVRLDLKEKGGL